MNNNLEKIEKFESIEIIIHIFIYAGASELGVLGLL